MAYETPSPTPSGLQVARILYKEIVEGDLRKIMAQANDSDSGGGARDFRFGSYPELAPTIRQMFPEVIMEPRLRDGVRTPIPIFKGAFYWQNQIDGTVFKQESFFEPPTDARPSEGRIVRVHEQPCFDTNRIQRAGLGDRVILLLIQRMDGTVWPFYTSESSLRSPGQWHPEVASLIINCINAHRSEGRAVIGFFDFLTNHSYCNGS